MSETERGMRLTPRGVALARLMRDYPEIGERTFYAVMTCPDGYEDEEIAKGYAEAGIPGEYT